MTEKRSENPYKPNSPEWQLHELAISLERQGNAFLADTERAQADVDRFLSKSRDAFSRSEEMRAAAAKLAGAI